MEEGVVTKRGRLRKKYLPAMYLDTSVLVDYWLAGGTEVHGSDLTRTERDTYVETEDPVATVAKVIINAERDFEKIRQIRRRICGGESGITCVVTPLSLIELIEWYADSEFKAAVAEATGLTYIHRRGKKQIGEYLRRTLEWYGEEGDTKRSEDKRISSGLEHLVRATMFDPSFAVTDGLAGLLLVDIINFKLSIYKVWSDLLWHAYLQIGLSDLMHVVVARHLGCQYVASFDSDFRRLFDCCGDRIGMTLVSDPDEILDVLLEKAGAITTTQ